LYACVKQPFVKTTEITNIEMVKSFMLNNNFSNSRFNDYVNEDKGTQNTPSKPYRSLPSV